jgi:hypothetical protein
MYLFYDHYIFNSSICYSICYTLVELKERYIIIKNLPSLFGLHLYYLWERLQ